MKIQKVSGWSLIGMFIAIIAVLVLFFFGGDAQGDALLTNVDPEMWQPANTDAMLFLNYALFAIAVIAAAISFVHFLVCNPKASMGSLYVLAGSVIVLLVTWFMGSSEKVEILGYEGTDNVGVWAQITDMFIFSLYFLLTLAVVCMLLGGVKKKLS